MRYPKETILRTTEQRLDRLAIYADKMGMSRNQLMNNILEIGLEELDMMNRLGLLRVGVGLRSLFMEKKDQPDGEKHPT